MCPACANKRLHTPDDWFHHPHAGHGFNGNTWTYPAQHDVPDAGAAASLRSGEGSGEAAPVGGER